MANWKTTRKHKRRIVWRTRGYVHMQFNNRKYANKVSLPDISIEFREHKGYTYYPNI